MEVLRKTNANAWGEDLAEDLRWELYGLTKAPTAEEKASGRPWLKDYRQDVVPHLEGRGLDVPSRSGWYRFLGRMRCQDRLKMVYAVQSANATARTLAREAIDDETAAAAFKGRAVDAAMEGDDRAAALYASAANAFRDRAAKAKELALKEAAQRTKEETLRLAREKWEFDVAKAAMEKAAEIRNIAGDAGLDADAKIAAVRTALFGEAAG